MSGSRLIPLQLECLSESLRNLLLIVIQGPTPRFSDSADLRWVLDMFIFHNTPKGFGCRLFKKYTFEDTDSWTQYKITKKEKKEGKMLPGCLLPSTTLLHSYRGYNMVFIGFCLFYLLFLKTLTTVKDLKNMLLTDHISLSSFRYSYEAVAEILEDCGPVSLASWVWRSCPMDECCGVLFTVSAVELQVNLLGNQALAQDNYQVTSSLKATESSSCKHSFLKSLHPPQQVLYSLFSPSPCMDSRCVRLPTIWRLGTRKVKQKHPFSFIFSWSSAQIPSGRTGCWCSCEIRCLRGERVNRFYQPFLLRYRLPHSSGSKPQGKKCWRKLARLFEDVFIGVGAAAVAPLRGTCAHTKL